MKLEHLIGECTSYDFKQMLEEKRPKSWLKSVSAFANGLGGSLFFGVDDDGAVRGLDDVQLVCETLSGKIRDYMDPLPDVELIPQRVDDLDIVQLKVNAGAYTPYYYVGDGQRIAFMRMGDESLPATAEQMVRLVLKGSNKTYDSLHTDYKVEDYSFTILANTFKRAQTKSGTRSIFCRLGLSPIRAISLMRVRCSLMIPRCGNRAYTAHGGTAKSRVMPLMMPSSRETY